MEIFTYNAKKPRESLEDFNQRLREYCDDAPVVAIQPQVIGAQLVIPLTTADDVEAMPGAQTLMPHVVGLDGLDDMLEETLTDVLGEIEETDDEQDSKIPYQLVTMSRADLPSQGWGVFIMINGLVTADEDEGPD
jgi:hypothetical protein